MAITVGAPAPDFTLPAEPGGDITLSALRGKPVVLYFYPKDSTPGCTTEACDFRDRMERLQAKGAVVLGVSRDSLRRHANFREKHGLNFPLLTDEDGALHQQYGAWGEKKLYGKVSIGPIRSTVLIDADGVVRQHWPKVRVKGHADAVLEALEAL
ncbi:MAG: thioredoxin-dependent thiol peroxidase [Myxococcales bacterium]|nr:thioredoxin-dependent thiol peroxidase [Myxococcales bacterium]MCB9521876.1 thioredoxin-dependent thiol peroxidase [Myxococcales bacterium]